MTIIFDLDGTLIDSSERLYELFQFLVPESTLSKEKYWELKRNGISHKQILERYFPEQQFEKFDSLWRKLIEEKEFLKLDCIYSDTIDILNLLEAKRLVLLTARQSWTELERELEYFNIKKFFDKILITEGEKNKKEILKEAIDDGIILKEKNDYFISDMGTDILVGNELGYKTIAISHGFMTREKLKDYCPNYIIEELSDVNKIIMEVIS